jgi:hypothetical protein
VSVRNVAMKTVDLGEAHIQQGDIDEGARAIGQAAELAVRNRSARLASRLRQVRHQLEPWQDSPVVRTLDEKMTAGRRA